VVLIVLDASRSWNRLINCCPFFIDVSTIVSSVLEQPLFYSRSQSPWSFPSFWDAIDIVVYNIYRIPIALVIASLTFKGVSPFNNPLVR